MDKINCMGNTELQLQESNKKLEEMHDILSASKMGTWHIEFIEGQAPTMEVDDLMRELLGIKNQELSPEETYDAWFSHIVPSEVPSVLESVRQMEQGLHSENTYLWEHPVLGIRYVRCGGTAKAVPPLKSSASTLKHRERVKVNTVYRFRIYPNKSQRELFTKTFGCVRFVYNRMLSEKKAHYEKTGKNLSVTPARYKSEFPWLKEVDSLALCNAQLHLQTAYKNFFRDASVGFPKFKSKKKPVRSYTTNYVNGNIVLQNGKLKLPKAGWVCIRQHRKIEECYQLKGATIIQEADERYYVALLYSCEEAVYEIKEAKSAIGLDFSMKELYVDSNGNHMAYPHFFQNAQQKLAKAQRKLSHCEQGSNRYKKQKKKVARIHTHIAHQRKDFLHKESRKTANSYDVVCIEDLNMKEMSQDMRFGKSVHDNGWGMFTDFLAYKMECAGKKLVRIDRWYPSSKTCSCCGSIKEDLQLSDRIYECACGNRMNRDENAAINICREGIRISGIMLDTEKKIS